MTMRVLYGVSPNDIKTFDTERLRAEFLIEGFIALAISSSPTPMSIA